MKKITAKQLKLRLDQETLKILDVRNEEKFQKDHLQHVHAENINIFKEKIFKLETNHQSEAKLPFSKEEEIIVTCTSGNSATRCSKILEQEGYNVTLLDGGMTAWHKQFSK